VDVRRTPDPLLRLPVEALSLRLRDAVRRNPMLEEEELGQPTGRLPIDREVMELDYEGLTNLTAPVDLEIEKEIMEPLEGLDLEFDQRLAEDVSTPDNNLPDVEQMPQQLSLYQQLKEQLERLALPTLDHPIAEQILGNLNAAGYLDTPLQEIARSKRVPLTQVEAVLKRLQEELEPAGVAARTPQEALVIQLWRRGGEEQLGYRILSDHFEDLLHGRWSQIGRKLGCSVAEVERAVHDQIAPLTLRLGASFGSSWTMPLVPDLLIEGDQVRLNEEPLPQLAISELGVKWLEEGCTPSEQRYLEKQLAQAKRLLKSYEERRQTLLRIGNYLLDAQSDYLSSPEGQLQPLTLRHLAQTLQLPLTTVQRAVAGKLIATPRGILPLRALFTNGYTAREGAPISAQTIRTWIADWVTAENPHKPLSDAQLSARLHERGVNCSRRTVAKYRSQLHIPGTAQRRKKAT
jgi:RNA polymerase sigma-54 factor